MAHDAGPVIPLLRVMLPSAGRLQRYLREIDANRWYTNFGPLAARLEQRLAGHIRIPDDSVALAVNGTTALSMALVAAGAPPGRKCAMPAWTFVASAAAARAANLIPHFVDVAADTWALDPEALRRRADLRELGAVLVVGPFGTPIETAPWDAFSAETGIPVVIDAAAGFDAAASVSPARPGTSPVMISLHATKAFAAGEGAIVLSTDEPLMRRVRRTSNFGIGGRSSASLAGFNGKMSEYHAAVGHAALDEWPDRRSALRSRALRYLGELARVPRVSSLPGFGSAWIATNFTVRLPCASEPVVERLGRIGIESRRWWGDGVHRHGAYRDSPRDPLPVTEDLARHVLSMPFSFDMTDAEIACVAEALAGALRAAPRNAAI